MSVGERVGITNKNAASILPAAFIVSDSTNRSYAVGCSKRMLSRLSQVSAVSKRPFEPFTPFDTPTPSGRRATQDAHRVTSVNLGALYKALCPEAAAAGGKGIESTIFIIGRETLTTAAGGTGRKGELAQFGPEIDIFRRGPDFG